MITKPSIPSFMPSYCRFIYFWASAVAVLLLCAWFVGSAFGVDWTTIVGSYSDSNPITVPTVATNPTAAEGWQHYD